MTEATDVELRLRRVEAALAVQNLMGRFELYHSAYRHDLVIPLFAARAETVIEMPFGTYRGVDAAQRAFGQGLRTDVPPRDLTGEYVDHVLGTPVIEVSPEGDRVRASWVSPGAEAHHAGWAGGALVGFWMWGRYAVEAVCDDGEWAFVEFRFATTFASEYGTSFAERSVPPQPTPTGAYAPDGPSPDTTYSPTWHPSSLPLGPEPFESTDAR